MDRMTGYLPHWLVIGFLMVTGTAIAIAQQPGAGQQMYSMTMMMNRMDSLMTEMHGMLPGERHMMTGTSMHGMMMMDSQTATDSLAWAMNATGSSMRDMMARMHQLLGEQGFIQGHGRQETLFDEVMMCWSGILLVAVKHWGRSPCEGGRDVFYARIRRRLVWPFVVDACSRGCGADHPWEFTSQAGGGIAA